LLLCGLAWAEEPAFVEVVPPGNPQPWVGQRSEFAIDVAVEGRFSGSTYFDLPEVAGAILMKVEGRPILSTRRIGDSEYTVQRHEFLLFGQKAGAITVPEIGVRCGSIPSFGEPVQKHSLSAKPINVEPRLPEGSRPGEAIVASKGLEITENWSQRPGKASVGDSFTRTVSFRAPDVPGMLLPSMTWSASDGLAVYPKDPEVQDRMERGVFTGERHEAATYVCEQPGHYEIPGVEFRWWHTGEEAWRTVSLPGVVLEVAPRGPGSAVEREETIDEGVTDQTRQSGWKWVGAGILAILLAAVLLVGMRRWRRGRPEEERVFDEVVQACRRNDPVAAYNAHTRWRAELAAGSGNAPNSGSHSSGAEEAWLELQKALVGADRTWDGRCLENILKARRRRMRRRTVRRPREQLPALNP
jgi:hypothetical protein